MATSTNMAALLPLSLAVLLMSCASAPAQTPRAAASAEKVPPPNATMGFMGDPAQRCLIAFPPQPAKSAQRRASVDRQIDTTLDKLTRCTVGMEDPPQHLARFVLDFAPSGEVCTICIDASTLPSCRVTDCVKSVLKGLKAPTIEGQDHLRYQLTLVLPRGLPVQRAERTADGYERPLRIPDDAGTCHDSPPVPTEPERPTQKTLRLPPELIQSTVRAQYGRFRKCYEMGLAKNGALQGRVLARFVIAETGHVRAAELIGNELPDCAAVRCMIEAYTRLVFPPPQNGEVTVVYPITFMPG